MVKFDMRNTEYNIYMLATLYSLQLLQSKITELSLYTISSSHLSPDLFSRVLFLHCTHIVTD